jgi:glycosidase
MNARPPWAAEAIDLELKRAPAIVRLARCLSIAARVEAHLLRAMRLECCRSADVGLESDLWFSPLVQAREPGLMMLRGDVREALHTALRQTDNRAELQRAWGVLERMHRGAPPVMRLEERATFFALSGQLGELERLLGGALEALTSDPNEGVARWVARRLPRMPQEVRESEPALALARAASERLNGIPIPGVLDAEDLAGGWSPKALSTLPRTKLTFRAVVTPAVGERRVAGTLEIISQTSTGTGNLAPHAWAELDVPKTRPLLVDVLTPGEAGWTERRVALQAGGQVAVPLPPGPIFRVRSLIGDELRIKPELDGKSTLLFNDTESPALSMPSFLPALAEELGWEATQAPLPLPPDRRAEAVSEARQLVEWLQANPGRDQRHLAYTHLIQRDQRRFEAWLARALEGRERDAPLLERKRTHFLLWRPFHTTPPPKLVIGRLQPTRLMEAIVDRREFHLEPLRGQPDLWVIAAELCGLSENQVYHYWFEVQDSHPGQEAPRRVLVTDPTAWTVDLRTVEDGDQPAAVVKYQDRGLVACDAETGATITWEDDPGPSELPANHRLVIYQLPRQPGSFRDVMALVEADGSVARSSHSHLQELGINALQVPAADGFRANAKNLFAPAPELGWPTELAALIKACHRKGIRIFTEMDLSLAVHGPYGSINFPEFHVEYIDVTKSAQAQTPAAASRDGFGGDLFRYQYWTQAYDPVSGERYSLNPARQLMQARLVRWMRDFRIDGIWLRSVHNVGSWDFIDEFNRHARHLWQERGAPDRFLVIGEELTVPKGLLAHVDSLWNEDFKRILRRVLLGRNADGETSFEWSVRKLIDCRNLGFVDTSQAMNYIGSDDVEGPGNERLYNYLDFNGVVLKQQRIQLAFVCLLTAVGIPMIFAGDEFADEHDIDILRADRFARTPDTNQQLDPVNYDRLERDPWRQDVFRYVSRLVKFRTRSDALAVNDTTFIHIDFSDGKRVLAWRRGREGVNNPVVVVANFSDVGTAPASEYIVTDWPATPPGRRWREITTDRVVPMEWIGREPLLPWEGKVYTVVSEASSAGQEAGELLESDR